jgi:hypothetical protein
MDEIRLPNIAELFWIYLKRSLKGSKTITEDLDIGNIEEVNSHRSQGALSSIVKSFLDTSNLETSMLSDEDCAWALQQYSYDSDLEEYCRRLRIHYNIEK